MSCYTRKVHDYNNLNRDFTLRPRNTKDHLELMKERHGTIYHPNGEIEMIILKKLLFEVSGFCILILIYCVTHVIE